MIRLTRYYALFFLFLLPLRVYAEHYWIDTAHEYVSKKVIDFAEESDKMIFAWLDGNVSSCQVDLKKTLKSKRKNVDSFFQSSKYLEETDDTFIRVRFDNTIETREKDDFKVKFSVQFPFSRCKKQFQFFMENVSSGKNSDSEDKKEIKKPEVGFVFIGSDEVKLKAKYSIGLSEFIPFAKARYHRPFDVGNWKIDPVQTFKYSHKYRFEEKTDIYFDTYIKDDAMFRFSTHRKTRESYDGMDYKFVFQLYLNSKEDSGLKFSQSFSGNTKYIKRNNNLYKGVNSYSTALSYRATIWRKWFYYEVTPSVNFQEKHAYKANYVLQFFLDFYFGRVN